MQSSGPQDGGVIRAIGIQLCNRLDYAKACLDSLANQVNFDVNICRIVIMVDKVVLPLQRSGHSSDNRDEIVAYARSLFPAAKFILPSQNLGVGGAFLQLQIATFEGLVDDNWAFFMEEDIVLEREHLHYIQKLISSVHGHNKVQKVSLFQGIFDYSEKVPYGGISMSEGTKCFAESKLLNKIVAPRLQEAFVIFKNFKDHKKEDRFSHLLLMGLHVPFYPVGKDFVVDECIAQAGYINLLWNIGVAKDIGVIGEGGHVWRGAITPTGIHPDRRDISIDELSLKISYELPRVVEILNFIRLKRAGKTQSALYNSMSIRKLLFSLKIQTANRLKSLRAN